MTWRLKLWSWINSSPRHTKAIMFTTWTSSDLANAIWSKDPIKVWDSWVKKYHTKYKELDNKKNNWEIDFWEYWWLAAEIHESFVKELQERKWINQDN